MLNFDYYGMFDYDEAGGDTYQYTSEEFSSLIQGITGNGISANYLNQFQPTANGLDITIKSGAAFVNGRWGYNSAAKTISLSPTTSTTKRIDRIVIELDVASRIIGLNTLVGTATTGTPTAPALSDNQLAICSVLVANGSNVTLTDERIFTYSAAEVQNQLNEIKANLSKLSYLPLSGGDMTGNINFGEGTRGCNWKTENGTLWSLRPYYSGNTFQLTFKPSGEDEHGAVNVNANGVMSLYSPLPVTSGGTGGTTADEACANIGALRIKSYSQGYTCGVGDASLWLAYLNNDTNKCQIDLYNDGTLRVNNSIVATEGRDNTFAGTLKVSNNNSAGGYVKFWEDGEGGNIALGSKSGKEFQVDAYNDVALRIYSQQSGSLKGMSLNGTNGNLSIDGDYYRGGNRVADVQHGTATVGTSGTNITFPRAFAGVPSVCANGSKQTSIRVENITKTGCTLVSGESNNTVQWIAAY